MPKETVDEFVDRVIDEEIFLNKATLVNALLRDDSELSNELGFMLKNISNNVECSEIYEWWEVSNWLAKKLIELGESVLFTECGQYWGRQTTGQIIKMDGIIQAVYKKIQKG